MKKIIYLLVVVNLTLISCNNNKKQSEAIKESTNETTTIKEVSSKEIIDGYLLIKNALVEDNSDGAVIGGKALLIAFNNFDMAKLTKDQHKEYMEILENAKEQTEHIVKSPIEHQREHFDVLSNDINDLITLLGTDKKIFQVFCPMFNDGKGAIWLSEVEEIKNPYYGAKMLKCGKIQKQFN